MDSNSTITVTDCSKPTICKTTLESLYNLDGYIKKGSPIFKQIGEKKYRIDQYQGCHADEYTVYELRKEGSTREEDQDGQAQHFKKGVIQLSWKMKNGARSGALTIYVNGVAERMTNWSSIRNLDKKQKGMKSTENRGDEFNIYGEVHNERGIGHVLIERDLTTDVIIYRGNYNPLSLRREGYGICYDNISGIEKSYGYYVDGELIHLIQEFVEENDLNGNENGKKGSEKTGMKKIMIEYGGDVKEDNISMVFNRHPVYIGDYLKESTAAHKSENGIIKSPYVRHGHGYIVNEISGFCDHESEWCNGMEKSESIGQLYCGWYDDTIEYDESINVSLIDRDICKDREEKLRKEREREREAWSSEEISICPEMNVRRCRGIEELIIGNNECNGNVCDGVIFRLEDMPVIQKLSIGSGNFQKVRGFVLSNLPLLQSMTIGNECFRITREWTGNWNSERQDGLFSISNCPKLTNLKIGDSSFTDFKTFSVSEVNSMKSIVFGKENFIFANCVLRGRFLLFTHDY